MDKDVYKIFSDFGISKEEYCIRKFFKKQTECPFFDNVMSLPIWCLGFLLSLICLLVFPTRTDLVLILFILPVVIVVTQLYLAPCFCLLSRVGEKTYDNKELKLVAFYKKNLLIYYHNKKECL